MAILKRPAVLNFSSGLRFFTKESMGAFEAFVRAFSCFIRAVFLPIMSDMVIAVQKHKEDLKKRQDSLPVQKHCSGGDGEQNKKAIDVLRTGLAGGGRGKNGHSKVVVSASASEGVIGEQLVHSGALAKGGGAAGAGIDVLRTGLAGGRRGKNGHSKVMVSALASEGAFGEQPVHSGALANGGGAGGVDPEMKKVAPPFSYGRKFGSWKEKEEMAFGEGRSLPVKSLVVLFLLGGMPVFASASFTLVFGNTCPIPIYPSLIPKGDSMKINNSTSLSAIDPSEERSHTLPDGWEGYGFFGTGCTSDGLAPRNCVTGNCEGRDCTAEDSPVATIYIISGDGYIIISVGMGYNLELKIIPMCVGCESASCKAELESCRNDLRLLNSSGAVVGCMPGGGLHFSEKQCTIPGDYSNPDVRITCPQKNCITKIRVSCQH